MCYDALLVVSFGGPEGPPDVLPFLENVLRGRNVPRQRMLEVAEHYAHFGGKSPINDQNRALIAALGPELKAHGVELPIYWGNRNWHPMLPDTVARMAADGVRRALAFVTSAYSGYSGCRVYLENLRTARIQVGPSAPEVDKLRVFFNHPGFIEPMADRVREAMARFPHPVPVRFTAHSVPVAMAELYVQQLEEACRLVAERLALKEHRLVYQSRSGPPSQPWLEPDLLDELRALPGKEVVVAPIGFISDHMEVIYDLDTEAQGLAAELGITMARAATVGTDPRFVAMIRELVEERLGRRTDRRALGPLGPGHDACPDDCCPGPAPRKVIIVKSGNGERATS
ncbi:MAG: ferrochelatase [Candidatus Eremiobacterota bacterium]